MTSNQDYTLQELNKAVGEITLVTLLLLRTFREKLLKMSGEIQIGIKRNIQNGSFINANQRRRINVTVVSGRTFRPLEYLNQVPFRRSA